MQPQHSEYETHPLLGQQAPQQGTWSMASPTASPVARPTGTQGDTASVRQAEDTDVIERDWVDAVKQAAADNRGDPYEFARALIALKVEYMKKRYNQDIKIPE